MYVDGRGATLIGASIVLNKDSRIWNMRLVDCDIDDLDATYPWAENCQIEGCKLRSQWEAEQKLTGA
jgi:hypothetical protein